jgi:hypothetical protein
MDDWPALTECTFAWFRERFGELDVEVHGNRAIDAEYERHIRGHAGDGTRSTRSADSAWRSASTETKSSLEADGVRFVWKGVPGAGDAVVGTRGAGGVMASTGVEEASRLPASNPPAFMLQADSDFGFDQA